MPSRSALRILLPLCLLATGFVVVPARADDPPDPWLDRRLETWLTELTTEGVRWRRAAARALFLHAPAAPEIEPALVAALADEEASVRHAALRALLRLPTPPLAALEQAARDADGRVAETALHALRERGDGDPVVLRAALEHQAPGAVLAAVRALEARDLESEACVEALARLATHERGFHERWDALDRLEALSGAAAAAAPVLVAELDGADAWYVQQVVRVLVALGPGAVPALLAGAPDGRRLRIVEAIQSRIDEPLPAIVAGAKRDDATGTSLTALLARHGVACAAGVPAALRQLEAGGDAESASAWVALAAAGPAAESAGWTLLRRLVVSTDDAPLAAEVVARMPAAARPYVPEMKDALRQSRPRDPVIRGAIAHVVRHAEQGVDLEFWQEMLATGPLGVQEEAAWALAPYADDLPDTWDALIATLRRSEHLESGAAEALVRIGKPIVPRLHEAFLSVHEAVPRFASALALARIGAGVIEVVEPLVEDERNTGTHGPWARLVFLHLDPSRTHLLRPLGWNLRNAGDPANRWFLTRLGRIRRPEDPLLGGLEGLIHDGKSQVSLRVEAVRTLVHFAPQSGLAMWILLGADASREGRIASAARAVLADQDAAAWRLMVPAAARALAPPPVPRRLTRAEVERIEPRFVSKEKRIRNNSIFEVARSGELSDDVVRAIAYCLDDRVLSVRLAAAHSLTHHGRVVEQRLLEALSDENLEIRVAAAQGLRLAGGSTEASLPYLMEALRDVDAAVEHAIRGSIALRDLRFAHLIRRYREHGSDLRYQLLSRIGRHGEEAWPILPLVPPLLEDERTRYAAIHVLLGMGRRGHDALARALADSTPETSAAIADAYAREETLSEGEARWLRDAAIRFDRMDASWPCFRAIARHDVWSQATVTTLVEKLEREPNRVEAGILLLARSGSQHAVPFFTTLLADEEHRRSALHALEELGPKAGAALGAVRDRLFVAEGDELRQALMVLGAMGEQARPAVEDLLELLDGDERVRKRAVLSALVKILPEEEGVRFLAGQLLDPDRHRRAAAASIAHQRDFDERLHPILEWLVESPLERPR